MTTLTRERMTDGIEVLRLDRPDQRNAMNSELLAALEGALVELATDAELRVLVISTTSSRALCAGADVAEELDHEGGVARMEAFARVYAAMLEFPIPTIAVCVGNVVGAGAELACACDLRVGGENLKLLFPGAKFGVPVGPARLTPLIGMSKAKELIYTSKVVGAEEADHLGLLAARGPEEQAEALALTLARTLAGQSASGLRQLKALFAENERLAERTANENEQIVAFQREGGSLPYGGVRGE
jgi:enoyl-CoA hydratase/carnithine racemase